MNTNCTTPHMMQQSNYLNRTQTDRRNVTFLSEKQVIESPKPGQSELVYPRGQHSWRFDIKLPSQLPPSLSQSSQFPYVRYYLKFVIDRPWYQPNIDKTLYVTVFPSVILSNNPQYSMESTFSNHNRKDVALRGHLNKLGYVPGETITGTLEIENPQQIVLKKIHVALFQNYQVESNTEKQMILETILPGVVNTNNAHINEDFAIALPFQQFAPSCHFVGGFRDNVSVHVDYFLEVKVHAEGMFTNFDVSVPMTLGTECNKNTNQHHQNEATKILSNSVSTDPDKPIHIEDPPPDYGSTAQ
ncbi:unnamed protein product [Rotaria sp. Silwood2]|nr:unnamed protein product [Rotaria sp. Silwood2]CAF3204219.1 unnamed protein product [Rotaria sp. Silwood2]CAF3395517.1 unnamed protein product [Rotaria sp. Silwood2]CAF3437734.1 unnamed protein product [Rotaria sp. Silwood2]CAF4472342.1 unnamed protein product [Rotaria sp. Silwood2]